MKLKSRSRTLLAALLSCTPVASAMAESPKQTFSECVRRGMIDNYMWVFGLAGLVVVSAACRVTAQ